MAKPRKSVLRNTRTCSLLTMLVLTGSFFLVEIIVGYVTSSVALIADSFHMLSDVISLVVGFFALRYSRKSDYTYRNTFGWQRAEVLGALINSVFLIALCFTIFVEALKRIVKIEEISNPLLILIVGGIGLFVNVIGLFMFHGHGHGHGHSHGGTSGHSHGHGGTLDHVHYHGDTKSHGETSNVDGATVSQNEEVIFDNKATVENNDLDHSSEDEFGNSFLKDAKEMQKFATVVVQEASFDAPDNTPLDPERHALNESQVTMSAQMNMRAVYLHVLGDAIGSVIVIASALCIKFGKGDWTLYVDPALSLVMVVIIMRSSLPLLKESALILMQTVPTHIKIQEIQERLLEQVEGVLDLHEFHVWQLAGDKIIASAHIKCRSKDDYMALANKVKTFFHNEGIHSTTIQPEFVDDPIAQNSELEECILDCGDDVQNDCSTQRCCQDDIKQRKRASFKEMSKDNEKDAEKHILKNNASHETFHDGQTSDS